VILPGETAPRRIARVIQHARPAAPTWEPGFVAVELVRVELEAEPPAGLSAALAAGWKAV
jgi:hypothetical protein